MKAVTDNDDVRVWLYPRPVDSASSDLPASLNGLLSPDERARAASCPDRAARRRLIWNRAFLRCMLAVLLDEAPGDILIETNRHGKPGLHRPDETAHLHFNLSHTPDWILLACGSSPLGADVERVRSGRDPLGLARRFFAPSEADELAGLAPDELASAFTEIWTVKEAVLKADGRGFGASAKTFTASETCGDEAPATRYPDAVSNPAPLRIRWAERAGVETPAEWRGLRFGVGHDHRACVAVREANAVFRFPQIAPDWDGGRLPAALGIST